MALAECCIAGAIGATVTLPTGWTCSPRRRDGRFVVSGRESALTGLPIIGRVGGDALTIGDALSAAVGELVQTRRDGLAGFLD